MIGDKILLMLVDRSHLSRRLMTMHLKKMEIFEVIACASVVEALMTLDEYPELRLVITGLHLPEIQDGLGLVEQIRTRYTAKTLPIMMISSSTDRDIVEKAIAAGVNDYLNKPVFPDALETRLQALLERPVTASQRIGDFLVERQLITLDQRDMALRYQRMYSSENIHISVLAYYMDVIPEDYLVRLFLEGTVEDEDFIVRAYTMGIPKGKLEKLREIKERHHLRFGDILVKLRYIHRETLEGAMKSIY